jgi:hypothetical protein
MVLYFVVNIKKVNAKWLKKTRIIYIIKKMEEIVIAQKKLADVKDNILKGLELIRELEKKLEMWKPVEGYPNYEVSSFGRVRNTKTGKILKHRIQKTGHCDVMLPGNGRLKHFQVHRLVATAFIDNPENKPLVDHINNDGKDNNIWNLRWCTRTENNRNCSISKANTSSVKGVYFDKSAWTAHIQVNGKKLHLGRFETLKEAKEVRQQKAKELFGEFVNKCEK